jgi:hypothetical protein
VAADFIMLALVHFIIAADAGETAKAAIMAAAINVFILNLALGKRGQRYCRPARYESPGQAIREEDIFVAMQRPALAQCALAHVRSKI